MALDTTAQPVNEDDFIDDAPPVPVDDVADDDAAPDEGGSAASDADDAPAADASAPAGDTATAPKAEGAADATTPVVVKVGGRDVAIDGLVQRPDGSMVVPKEHTAAYLDLIRDGVNHRTTFRERLASERSEAQQQVQAAQTEIATHKADATRATTLLEKYDTLIAERIGSPEAAERFFSNYAYEMQLLQRDLQLAQQQVQSIVPEAPSEPDPLADDDYVAGEVARHAAEIMQQGYAGVFSEADYAGIAQYVQQTARQHLKPADRDYPDLGVRKGEMVVDRAALNAYLRSLAAGRTLASDANRAAAANAASPGAPRAATSTARPARAASAPPAMTSRAASAAAAPAPAGPPRTRAEWDQALRNVSGSSAGDSEFDL